MVNVDVSTYGRAPDLFGHLIAMLRLAFGDFSLIHPYEGFDLKDPESGEYIHSYQIMIFTFFMYIVSSFLVYMILMNFIIAVIADSY